MASQLPSVLCSSGRLPDWMTGPDSTSESSDDEDDGEAGAGGLPFWLKESNENYEEEDKEKDDPPPPEPEIFPAFLPPPALEEIHGDSGVEEEEEEDQPSDVGSEELTLTRDYTLNVKPGVAVELLDLEKIQQLMDREVLSPVLCGLLNTRLGGKIFIGVKRCGLIRGIVLERKKRDLVRQLLDRIFNNNINPRVGPNLVDVDFVRVVDKKMPRLELHIVVMTVQGQARDKVFSVQGFDPEINGTYTRKESPGENNMKIK